ncbi:LysR substrate-binding domain-containing protein [Comamonas badia]|uniref:LysR substrate-binding domain-containing protein n=1 Tax=Comamonas badia TaxID=265291 RepID=UPI00041D4F67|nr:LysR substrate-binding domain-containing protein [Comamonas badia]
MQNAGDTLTPDNLRLLQAIAIHGSFAAAARALALVPSALTYRVRQIEQQLDVLLFDRSRRQAVATEAGRELLREGERLLAEMDAVAQRVQRVATGWEPQLTLSVDGVVSRTTMLELIEAFYALGCPTRLRWREGTLTGTLEQLTGGQADLAIGVAVEAPPLANLRTAPLGDLRFVFAVAPHHPLATAEEPIADAELARHRMVAVADSARQHGATLGLLPGQEVLTVQSLATKLRAQLRGLGAGYLPQPMAQPYIDAGQLVVRDASRAARTTRLSYAWCDFGKRSRGRALQWWLDQLQRPVTRRALLQGHHVG